MKNLRNCKDITKVTRLILVRHQNIGPVIKGMLFCDDVYLCDTNENSDTIVEKGNYELGMTFWRPSLSMVDYRESGWRIYLRRPEQRSSLCRITNDEYKPEGSNIGIGWRMGSMDSVKNNILFGSRHAYQVLTAILSEMDCVLFHIVDADRDELEAIQGLPLWHQTADISKAWNASVGVLKNIKFEDLIGL